MIINGKEYLFSYTVEVSCAREERKTAGMSYTKSLVELALLMNKAHEDREKFYNPDYNPNYLSREELLMQNDIIIPALDAELAEVCERESRITVMTAPPKKKAEVNQ